MVYSRRAPKGRVNAHGDLDAIPDGEPPALPGGAIPPGRLTEFFGRRAALIHQKDADEPAIELSGDSGRHPTIFRGTFRRKAQAIATIFGSSPSFASTA